MRDAGTVLGVQLAAVFQSLLIGSLFQVALLPWSACKPEKEKSRERSVEIFISFFYFWLRKKATSRWVVVQFW